MPLNLKPGETCQFSSKCPYNGKEAIGFCQGSNPDRKGTFNCEFVDQLINMEPVFREGKNRNQYDVTGKMKVIME